MKKEIKVIDGAYGEGGGQILRSALSLSMCTGTPIRIEGIRAGRKKSGLLRQHLACVKASQEICQAQVTGAELGAPQIEFFPGKIKGGDYEFAIGSAGSTTLLFQTVLPALLMAESSSTVRFSGGTHNDLAPSFDFIQAGFLPMVKQMGIEIGAELHSYGFMPTGGGAWTATIPAASQKSTLDITHRDDITKRQATVTQAGISKTIAERELTRIQKKLKWSDSELHIRQVESIGPGNIVSLRVSDGCVCEVVEVVGAKALSAERVAGRAAAQLKRYLASGAAIGEHLCDQLLLPLALGMGGKFTTTTPSQHTLTNIHVIQQFLDCEISIRELDHDLHEVNISPH